MAHVLHLVGNPPSPIALDAIARHAAAPDTQVSVVLLSPDVQAAVPPPTPVYRLERPDYLPADPDRPVISAAALLRLIFAADSVIVW